MPVSTIAYQDVCAQRDRLARAIKRVLKPPLMVNGFGCHVIPSDAIRNLQRAMELTFPEPHITPLGRRIINSFPKRQRKPR